MIYYVGMDKACSADDILSVSMINGTGFYQMI